MASTQPSGDHAVCTTALSSWTPGMRKGIEMGRDRGSAPPFPENELVFLRPERWKKAVKIAVHAMGEIVTYGSDLKYVPHFTKKLDLKI